jgi:hypothetical protein
MNDTLNDQLNEVIASLNELRYPNRFGDDLSRKDMKWDTVYQLAKIVLDQQILIEDLQQRLGVQAEDAAQEAQ